MNRSILTVGLFVFALAVFVPPYEAVSHGAAAAAGVLGGRYPEPEVTIAVVFVGPDENLWRDAHIAADLWLAVLFAVAFLTVASALVAGPATDGRTGRAHASPTAGA